MRNAQPKLDELTKALKTDLSDNDIRWEFKAQIDIIATLKETWQKKLDYIQNLLKQSESQVLGVPLAETSQRRTQGNTGCSLCGNWTKFLRKPNRHSPDGKYWVRDKRRYSKRQHQKKHK